METENATRQTRRLKVPEILFFLFLMLLFVILALPHCGRISEKGNITKGVSNCRQIIMSLRIYADDHDGKYPDSVPSPLRRNANEAFRILFTEYGIDNEMIFGCPVSPYVPDGNIGSDEERSKSLEPGENHWALTAGMNVNKAGNVPLVFENPSTASWPPKWNADAKEEHKRGRIWKNGVIVGLNDQTVSVRKLEASRGTSVGLAKERDGKDLFELAIDPVTFPKGEVLDIDTGE